MNAELTLDQAIRQMLATYPHSGTQDSAEIQATLKSDERTYCIETCIICATTCTACADACLAEDMVKDLTQCIRTNLDCALICQATGAILIRQTEADWRLLYHQVEACQTACRTCATICQQHAEMHEHCRVCAEACHQCEQACDKLLATFPV